MSSKSFSNYSNEQFQTDAELFLQLQNGHIEVLAILYDRHAALVYSVALKMLGNTAEAEDLTQDIFLSLTKECSYDSKRGSLRTYLAILTRSRARDRLRSHNRQQQKLSHQTANESAKVLSETPMYEIFQQERSQKVKLALAKLSIKEREVLEMAYYQGLSKSKIAQKLNIALGTVKSRARRGLLKLRQALSELEEES
ncbi:MAG: sigma-70 family RNA polymerase sigma factor [Cyanobacteria bacterium J06621_8]